MPQVDAPVPKAAAVYARISHDPKGDHLGVDRQRADCQALAARHGWTIAEEYIDNDVSAFSGKRRPEYQRMLADIKSGAIDGVIVYNLDRLHRQPRELEPFLDLCEEAKLTALKSVEGDINLATTDGRFQARILGAMHAKASEDTSRRVRRKNLELAEQGKPGGGGARPYGYRADRLTVEPGEAAVIREVAARVLAGASLRASATDLNDRGVRTVSGRPWTIQVLGRMLTSARLSGQREYHGEIVATGIWEPILTPDQTQRLRLALAGPDRATRHTVRKYLLSGGLLRCGRCGGPLAARPQADGARRYVCIKGPGQPGCGGTAIKAEPVETFVTEAVTLRLDSPMLAATLAGKVRDDAALSQLQTYLAEDQAQLTEIAEVYAHRTISLAEYLAARKPIQHRIDSARRQLAKVTQTEALDRYVGSASVLRDGWPDLPITRQHAIIAAVLDHAVVAPAVPGRAAFDPARLTPLWRL
jgi:DNA invertase Pin-like site-specific DNA recombinase